MTESLLKKDKTLYGTKVYNHKTKELGLIISTWFNIFSKNGGGYEDIAYATCVDYNGRQYNTPMDNIQPIEDMDEEELKKLGLK